MQMDTEFWSWIPHFCVLWSARQFVLPLATIGLTFYRRDSVHHSDPVRLGVGAETAPPSLPGLRCSVYLLASLQPRSASLPMTLVYTLGFTERLARGLVELLT